MVEHSSGLSAASPLAEPDARAEEKLPWGVATGDVTSDSAQVWFRTNGPALTRVEWVPDDGSAVATLSDVLATTIDHDFTATVALHGLSPGTRYRYWVHAAPVGRQADFDGVARRVGSGRFATPPAAETHESVTFLWSGDIGGHGRCRLEHTGYAIFDRMLHTGQAFTLMLGDLIYGDAPCPSPPNVPGSDFVATTLDDYRTKHRYQRGDPALQRFLADAPVYAIWDDHEVRNNFAGPHDPLMPVGRQALLEYWPIRTPPEDPHRLYRQFRRGADLELFILDTRQYRSRNAEPDGEQKTMLGAAQRDWLLEGLTRSTATWKVVATSVPLSNPKAGTAVEPGNDSWARAADGTGFQSELRTIVKTILDRRIRNIVWLAADVHYVQVNEYDPDRDGRFDFYEFISGPLSAGHGRPVPPDPAFNPTTLYSEGGFFNFGVVTVNGTSLRLDIQDEAGRSRFARTFEAEGPSR